jgi:Putative zinc ribbon domain
MEPQKFCQSCTLPLDNMEDRGTEKDGSKSDMYCKYCYQNGAFTEADMTLDQMMEIAETEMKKQNLPENIIQQSMNMLPRLKRWQTSPAEMKA